MTFGITDGGIFQSIFRRPNRADSKPRVVVVEKNHETTILFFDQGRRRGERKRRFGSLGCLLEESNNSATPKRERQRKRALLKSVSTKRHSEIIGVPKKTRHFCGKKKVEDGKEEGAQKDLSFF